MVGLGGGEIKKHVVGVTFDSQTVNFSARAFSSFLKCCKIAYVSLSYIELIKFNLIHPDVHLLLNNKQLYVSQRNTLKFVINREHLSEINRNLDQGILGTWKERWLASVHNIVTYPNLMTTVPSLQQHAKGVLLRNILIGNQDFDAVLGQLTGILPQTLIDYLSHLDF